MRLSHILLPASLEFIGDQAFRDCGSLASLTLGARLVKVGDNAFYAAGGLTLYIDASADVSGWSEAWNSTFLPVIYGCETSPEGYVISVTGGDGSVVNIFSDTRLGAPEREGHTLLGWSADPSASDAEIAPDGVTRIGAGERFYAVYAPDVQQ